VVSCCSNILIFIVDQKEDNTSVYIEVTWLQTYYYILRYSRFGYRKKNTLHPFQNIFYLHLKTKGVHCFIFNHGIDIMHLIKKIIEVELSFGSLKKNKRVILWISCIDIILN